MFNLIPISLLIIAIGGVVYIISNHLSEFSDKNGEDGENDNIFQFNLKARFVEWMSGLPLNNIKSQSLSLTQKLLHRFRLVLLKTDNHLMKLIGKISERDRQANGNGSSNGNGAKKPEDAPDFWEEFAKKKNEEQIAMPAAEPELKIDLAVKNETAKNFFDIKPAKKSARAKKSLK